MVINHDNCSNVKLDDPKSHSDILSANVCTNGSQDGVATSGFATGTETGSETVDIPEYEENMQKLCRNCSRKLYPVQLQLCQINFEEAIFLCVQEDCQFPLLEPDVADFIVKRNIAQLAQVLRKRGQLKPQPNASPDRNSKAKSPTQAPFVSPQSALEMLNLFPDDILYDSLFSTDESSQDEAMPIVDTSTTFKTARIAQEESFGSDQSVCLDTNTAAPISLMECQETVESENFIDGLLQSLPSKIDSMESSETVDSNVSNILASKCDVANPEVETAVGPNTAETEMTSKKTTTKSSLSDSKACNLLLTTHISNTACGAVKLDTPSEKETPVEKTITKTINNDKEGTSEQVFSDTAAIACTETTNDKSLNDAEEINNTPSSSQDIQIEVLSSPTSPIVDVDPSIYEDEKNDPSMYLKEVPANPVGPPPRHQVLVQWKNNQNSCWLDVLLHCFVSTPTVRLALNSLASNESDNKMLLRLCNLYDSCQEDLKNGLALTEVQNRMESAQNGFLSFLISRFQLQPGAHEGAAEMFRNIMKINKSLSPFFSVTLRWEFECDSCEHKEIRRVTTELVSFLSPTQSFHPLNATSLRSCSSCSAKDQSMTMVMEKVPACLMMHFQHGLTHNRFSTMDFGLHGHLFAVCAVVQYITDTFNHFIVWIRDCKANKWMCCDDLETSKCCWQKKPPKIHPKQIHMIMWEKQGILPSFFSVSPPPEGALQHLKPVDNLEAALSDDEIISDVGEMETIDLEEIEEKPHNTPNPSVSKKTLQLPLEKPSNTPEHILEQIPIEVSSLSPVDDGISNIVLSDSDTSDNFTVLHKKQTSKLVFSPTSSDASCLQLMSPKPCESDVNDKSDLPDTKTTSSEYKDKGKKVNTAKLCELDDLSPRSYTAVVKERVSAKRPQIVLEDVVKTGTYQQSECSSSKRRRSSLSCDEPMIEEHNVTVLNACEETNVDKRNVQSDNVGEETSQAIELSDICTSKTDEKPQNITLSENIDNESNKDVSNTKHYLRKKKSSPLCTNSDASLNPITELHSDSCREIVNVEKNALKEDCKTNGTQNPIQLTDNVKHVSYKKRAVKQKGKYTSPQLKSDSVLVEDDDVIPSLVQKPKKKRRTKSRLSSRTSDSEESMKHTDDVPKSPDADSKASEPVPEMSVVQKVECTIDQPALLESKLESVQEQSPLRPKHHLPMNSTTSGVGGLAVIKTSPSIFPSQPTFIYRPSISPVSPTSSQGKESIIPSTTDTITSFRKLPKTKTREKSKLLGPGSMFESYTPKRFRLVGYEKKNLKTWQAGASSQTPYKANKTNLQGNRQASFESSDKSSEVSDLTDVPDMERSSTEGSVLTTSTRTSRNLSHTKSNASQRTTPVTDPYSLSPSSLLQTPFDDYASLQDSTSATSYSSLGTETQDPAAFDDFLSGIMNGDDLSSLAHSSGSSTTVPGDTEGELDFFSMLDM
uniref:Uncharacterized protein LOC100179148 n=1 Tax=Phallusia mammillata TaxID=59560 RepID=A0A6F9DH67_9ASCI|nr:uncharacterized protein LOC100179148 [Phallusia mammillata]